MSMKLKIKKNSKTFIIFLCFILYFEFLFALDTSNLKKSAPIYQNPFDLASGGASLTRASQEGVLFSNPSLPPFGDGVFRTLYLRNSVKIGSETVSLAKNTVSSLSQFSNSKLQSLITDMITTPMTFGVDNAIGLVTSNVGFGGFAVVNVNVEGSKFGSIGLPELYVRNFGFAGIATTFSAKFADIISVGIGTKYIYNGEINTDLGINDILNLNQGQQKIIDSVKYGHGISTDIGVTLQKRSRFFDVRLAGVISDYGNTTFTGGVPPWLQTYNVGFGFTIHNFNNAFHCALDYRDVTNIYAEQLPKKIYMGCKLLLTRYLGFGAGYLQGWPTYGMVINFISTRIEVGTYTKDVGVQQAGFVGRKVYFLSLGFDI